MLYYIYLFYRNFYNCEFRKQIEYSISVENMAGLLGFEPRLTGPKPVALPLGYSPTIWRSGRDSDRKSTRLNSSHVSISYAVFCLKKKTNKKANSGHYE